MNRVNVNRVRSFILAFFIMRKIYKPQKIIVGFFIIVFLITGSHLNAVYIKKSDIRENEKEILQLINFERSSRGIKPLKYDSALFMAAELHNRKMIKMNKLGHKFRNYKSLDKRIKDVDVFFTKAGENIAFSTTYVSEHIHKGFMESKSHKENILDKEFTHCGISFIETKKGFFITQEFANILAPVNTLDLENNLKRYINTYSRKNFNIVPEFVLEKRDSLCKIARKVLKGEKIKNIPDNIEEFDMGNIMVNIVTSSISEISDYLKESIKGKRVSKYSIGVIFGRSPKFIGGAYSVVFIFSISSKFRRLNLDDIEENLLVNINMIRLKSGYSRVHKSKCLSRYAKKIALKYFKNPGNRIRKIIYNILVYKTDNPEIIPEIHAAFFLSGKKRSSIGLYIFNVAELGLSDDYYLLAFVLRL